MIPVPPLYPGEILSSGLIRCCRWFDLPFKVFARKVLQRPGLRSHFLSTWPLEALELLYGIPAQQLLWNHTQFPYATAFVDLHSFTLAQRAALHGGSGMAQLLGVMRNASAAIAARRACLRCVEQDNIMFGESYWHREHNLPGVFMCAKHRCRLVLTDAPATRSLKTTYLMPIECEATPLPAWSNSTGLLQLAELSHALLHRPMGPGAHRDARFYRALAAVNGWLTPDRQVQQQALTGSLQQRFPDAFMAAAGVQSSALEHWSALAFRPGNPPTMSTVKHLLLETILRRQAPRQSCLDHASSGPPASGARLLDGFYSARANAVLRQALGAREVLTTEQFLRRAGAFGAYRHRCSELPTLRGVVLQFRASPVSVRQLKPGRTLFPSRPGECVPARAPFVFSAPERQVNWAKRPR